MSARILIVDDAREFAATIARNLKRAGHTVATRSSAAEARAYVADHAVDVVVLDYQLPDGEGLTLLDELQRLTPSATFLFATGYPDTDVAVEAMRRGAVDYVQKGSYQDDCYARIERAAAMAVRNRERMRLEQAQSNLGLLGDSAPIRRLRERVHRIKGGGTITMLILGETGTGKSMLAQAIHKAYGKGNFVEVDCAAIAASLIESELFGYERAAFTGATASKAGRIEGASGGTLFLDEIGELGMEVQAKLLGLIDNRKYCRVGGVKPQVLDTRIIAATHRDLAQAARDGAFRQDLRFRLEVLVVEVPPLRKRAKDVLLLASHFAAERARLERCRTPTFATELSQALLSYKFPGNVRELRNMVDQAMLLAEGRLELTLDDFPVLSRAKGNTFRESNPPPPSESSESEPTLQAGDLADIRRQHASGERDKVLGALQREGGNVSKAARHLGISRHALTRRIRKYGIR